MPNIKSAKKRVLINEKKALGNRIVKNNLRTTIKNFSKTLEAGDKGQVEAACQETIKKIDQAASRGVLHKNTASRRKSQIAIKANRATGEKNA